MLIDVVGCSVLALEPLTTQELPPSVAMGECSVAPPAVEPLNVVTPASSVKVSSPAAPSSDAIELKLIPATVPALGPLMVNASATPVPVRLSVPDRKSVV